MVTSTMTPEAFYEVYKQILPLMGETKGMDRGQARAYEKTEEIHEILHGVRKYSCYRSFIRCCIEYPFMKRHKELLKKKQQTSIF